MTNPVSPRIGSYSNPKKEAAQPPSEIKIEDKRKKTETPSSVMVDGIQSELEQGVDGTKTLVEKSKSYEEILSENEIPRDKAHRIVDDMLHKGFYEENIDVTKESSVTFRTRVRSDYIRYLRALEFLHPKFIDEQQEIMQRYYLAASLVSFKGETFSHPDSKKSNADEIEAAFAKRLEWVEKQGETLVFLLAQKLSKFDRIISVVMSEGVVENF